MRTMTLIAVLAAIAAPGAALADPTRETAARPAPAAKSDLSEADMSKAGAKAPAADAAAPFNPRWVARKWTITGLTVWTYRPGHFQRN
ncbi:hypothetical protein [Aquabacter spiritensis]|uniref:Uncharacterized protein n=1 Tax=Aquabacter spiritensis TaxID=933073 RepID=A0A4R3LTQ3_9HYPH|nr:hypothetical protein [Aquabacter spiritensis]TCT03950.1 hypothetical protein EDC64_108116 [Aquabacter spiritensis]